MKKLIIAIILMLAFASLVIAGTIKPSGMSQKDLYNLLNSIVTKHNALSADYTTLKTQLRAYKSYSTVKTTVTAAPGTIGGLSLTQ